MKRSTAALPALLLFAGNALAQAHQPPKVEVDDYQWQHSDNPYTGNADSVAQGRRLYRSTCYICHLDSGAGRTCASRSFMAGTSSGW